VSGATSGLSGSRPVVLVGFMGAGKSTVGRLVAGHLGRRFVDSDEAVTERAGRTPREIFATAGEAVFRALEHTVIAELVRRDGEGAPDPLVVALGGGSVEDPRTRAALDGAYVVYLEVSHAEALRRVGTDPGRPVLARPDLEALHARRAAAYREVADVVVVTDGRPPEEIAKQVLTLVAAEDDDVSSEHLVE